MMSARWPIDPPRVGSMLRALALASRAASQRHARCSASARMFQLRASLPAAATRRADISSYSRTRASRSVCGSRSSLPATVSARPISAGDRLGSSRSAVSYSLRASVSVASDGTASICCNASARDVRSMALCIRERLRKNAPPLGFPQRIAHLDRQPRDEVASLVRYPRLLEPDVTAPHLGSIAGVRESGLDDDLVADRADLAFHQVPNVEFASERARIDRLPLVR